MAVSQAHVVSLRSILQKERLSSTNFLDWKSKHKRKECVLDEPISSVPDNDSTRSVRVLTRSILTTRSMWNASCWARWRLISQRQTVGDRVGLQKGDIALRKLVGARSSLPYQLREEERVSWSIMARPSWTWRTPFASSACSTSLEEGLQEVPGWAGEGQWDWRFRYTLHRS